MSITLLAMILAGLSGLFLVRLGYLFWTDPEKALTETDHHKEQLPHVMADRYLAFAIIGVFAAFYGDVNVLIVFFLACAVMAFVDAEIYRRADKKTSKHMNAGVLSLVAFVVACAAGLIEGAS